MATTFLRHRRFTVFTCANFDKTKAVTFQLNVATPAAKATSFVLSARYPQN